MHFVLFVFQILFLYFSCIVFVPFRICFGWLWAALWAVCGLPGAPRPPSNITENFRYARFPKSHGCNCPVLFCTFLDLFWEALGRSLVPLWPLGSPKSPICSHMFLDVGWIHVYIYIYIYTHTSILSFYGILHFL